MRAILASEVTDRGVIDLRGHVAVSDGAGTELFQIAFPMRWMSSGSV